MATALRPSAPLVSASRPADHAERMAEMLRRCSSAPIAPGSDAPPAAGLAPGMSRSTSSASPGRSSRNLKSLSPFSDTADPFSPPISTRAGCPGNVAVVPTTVPKAPFLNRSEQLSVSSTSIRG
jgi:hypothetical protein